MVDIMEDPVKEVLVLGGKGVKGGFNLAKDGLVGSHNLLNRLSSGAGTVSSLLAITGLVGFLALKAYNGIEDDITKDTNTRLYAPIIRTVEQESSQNENGFPYKSLAALTGAALLGAGAVLGTQSYRNRSREVTLENIPEVRDAVQRNYRD